MLDLDCSGHKSSLSLTLLHLDWHEDDAWDLSQNLYPSNTTNTKSVKTNSYFYSVMHLPAEELPTYCKSAKLTSNVMME